MKESDPKGKNPVSLGIEGLPAPYRELVPGELYAVMVRDAAMRRMLVTATLHQLEAVGLSAVCASTDPGSINGELRKRRGSAPALVQLFTLEAGLEDKLRVHGLWALLDELEGYGMGRSSCLVLEPAEGLLQFDHPLTMRRQASLYRDWLCQHRCAGILVLSFDERLWQTLRGSRESFGGIAQLAASGQGWCWTAEYWLSQDGLAGGDAIPVKMDWRGGLYALNQLMSPDLIHGEAPDEGHVIVSRGVVLGEAGVPASWAIAEDLHALEGRANKAVAATIVMDYSNPADFEVLSRLVHRLRLGGGRRLKLLVRERGVRLRYPQELLLLHLGANALIYADVHLSRMLPTLVALQGQVYGRALEGDYDAVVAAANPDLRSGYLAPNEFCGAVRDALDHGEIIGLDSVLVKLRIASAHSHIEALRACLIKRPGDFFTADDGSIYLFLYACPESALDVALRRIFSVPLYTLFDHHEQFSQAVSIQDELDRLQQRAGRVALLDFSEIRVAQSVDAGEAEEPSHAPSLPGMSKLDEAVPSASSEIASMPRGVSKVKLPLLRKGGM